MKHYNQFVCLCVLGVSLGELYFKQEYFFVNQQYLIPYETQGGDQLVPPLKKSVFVLHSSSFSHESIIMRPFYNENLGHCECFGYRKFTVLCQEAEK